jgi:hypothetical protein
MTILSALFGNGRCSALASSHGAHPDIALPIGRQNHRITGIAFSWIGATTALAIDRSGK